MFWLSLIVKRCRCHAVGLGLRGSQRADSIQEARKHESLVLGSIPTGEYVHNILWSIRAWRKDIEAENLASELQVFMRGRDIKSLADVVETFKDSEAASLFPNMERLLQGPPVLPCGKATAESSSSALR